MHTEGVIIQIWTQFNPTAYHLLYVSNYNINHYHLHHQKIHTALFWGRESQSVDSILFHYRDMLTMIVLMFLLLLLSLFLLMFVLNLKIRTSLNQLSIDRNLVVVDDVLCRIVFGIHHYPTKLWGEHYL